MESGFPIQKKHLLPLESTVGEFRSQLRTRGFGNARKEKKKYSKRQVGSTGMAAMVVPAGCPPRGRG